MRLSFLPFSPPTIGEEEIAAVIDTLQSDWITTGPKVHQYEAEFADFLGVPTCLALNSCTAGLHTALVTLGIGPGDLVMTTPMTFCATANVIEHVGARPILVDVEPDTLNIDPIQVRAVAARLARQGRNGQNGAGTALHRRAADGGGRLKAIIPVHYAGHPADMTPLREVAQEHKLAVIEDAAHALPATYKGQCIGTLPAGGPTSMTAFSFYATKNLTTAEGGMLTGSPQLLDKARIISLHGMSRDAWKRYSREGSWYYEVVCPGFKYNMTDIHAAIGIQQLRKLCGFHSRRQAIVKRYNEAFGQFEELQTPTERTEVTHAWHLYVLRLNLEHFAAFAHNGRTSALRNQVIEDLTARNIGTSVHFIPIHLHPYYREKYGYQPDDFPVAYREYRRMLSLPLTPRMTDQDVDDVIEAVIDIVHKYRR
jgi:dTDP-4-amino-4,6-dideoxygalactose transaminase